MSEFRIFETERLVMRPTSEEDADFIFELFNTPKWLKYIGDRNVTSVESARDYIKTRILPQQDKLGYSSYTLIRKADDAKIGTCGLYDREGLKGIDIGFALLPGYEGHGFAYESASKLLDAAFNVFGLNAVSAITTIDNISSHRLLEKLGLELDGTTKLPNDDEELQLYRILNQPTDPFINSELTTILVVSDLNKSKQFYLDVLGAELYREYGGSSVVLKFLNNWILLVLPGGPTEDKPGISFQPASDQALVNHSFTIRVQNCHESYNLLKSKGAVFLTPPYDWGQEVRCFFRDPDGHLFEISEYKK